MTGTLEYIFNEQFDSIQVPGTSLIPNEVGTVQILRDPTVSLFDSLGKTHIRVPDQYCTVSYAVEYSKIHW